MKGKSELRDTLLEKRAALSSSQVHDYSDEIIKKLIGYINWQEIKNLNIYQAIKLHKEVNLNDLLNFLKLNYPRIRIDKTTSNPVTQNIPSGKNYDLVIVPLVGFDRKGNRLGYGGGYYDKFLAKNNYKQTVGLAYSFQEVANLPVEPFDQKIQTIITENEIINTK